jgi:hypothetical protein
LNQVRGVIDLNHARLLLAAIAVCSLQVAVGAESGSRAGHGHVSVNFQVIRVDGFQNSVAVSPIGTVDTQSLDLHIEYYLTDRITLSAGIPYVKKRYNGGGQHNPLLLDPPRPYIENVDALDWNTDFQDFHVGVRYLAKDGPVMIEPYAYIGLPSHEYAFFGHAAVGQQLFKFDIGTTITWVPGLSNAYYRADVGYVFVEETLGVNIDHWLINGEVGYFFGPRLTGRVFAQLKKGHGLTFPNSFDTPRTGEQWYQHDRLVKHNFANAGIGLDWDINDKYQLHASALTMIWEEQVHIMEYTFGFGVSRSF